MAESHVKRKKFRVMEELYGKEARRSCYLIQVKWVHPDL